MVRVNGEKTIITLPNPRYLPLIAKLVPYGGGCHYQIHGDSAYVVVKTSDTALIDQIVALESPAAEAQFLLDTQLEEATRKEQVAKETREREVREANKATMNADERHDGYHTMLEELYEEARQRSYDYHIREFEFDPEHYEMEEFKKEAAEKWLLDGEEPQVLEMRDGRFELVGHHERIG